MTVTEIGAMVVRLLGDSTSYTKMLNDAAQDTVRVTALVSRQTAAIEQFGNKLSSYGNSASGYVKAALGIAGVATAGATAFRAINLAAQAEKMDVAFGTMLQSMEKGKVLVADLQRFAADTPLTLNDVTAGAKQLLQVGVQMEGIIPTLRMLGDVTGGDKEKFSHMVHAYGEMFAQGHLTGYTKNMMLYAGFNPLAAMAEQLAKEKGGTATQYMPMLQKMEERGQITAKVVQDVFRKATSEGGRFFNYMQTASRTLDGLFSTMQDDVEGFLREFGKSVAETLRLKEIMMGVSTAAQALTKWFKEINPRFRSFLEIAAVGVITLLSLGAAVMALGVAVSLTASVVGTVIGVVETFLTVGGAIMDVVLGPWMLLLVPLVPLLALFAAQLALVAAGTVAVVAATVSSLGGVEKTWELVKQAAVDAWDWARIKMFEFEYWARPIWTALKSFFTVTWTEFKTNVADGWETIKLAAQYATDQMSVYWTRFTGGSVMDWEKVRTTIVEGIWAAEFAVTHFGLVWETMSMGAYYWTVRLGNTVKFFFSDQFVPLIAWAAEAWTTTWTDMLVAMGDMFLQFTGNVVNVMRNLPGLISGEVAWDDVWKPLENTFKSTVKDLVLPERVPDEAEKTMRDLYEYSKDRLKMSWEEFKEMKRREVEEATPTSEDVANTAKVPDAIKNQAAAAEREVHKMNAALYGSAEAYNHIEEYRARMEGVPNLAGGGGPGGAAGMPGASINASPAAGTPPGADQLMTIAKAQLDVQTQSRDILLKILTKDEGMVPVPAEWDE